MRSLLLPVLFAVSCSQSSTTAPVPDTEVFETSEIALQPGEEKYVCYARTFDHDIAIDRFNFKATNGIHHGILARTLVNEPEGISECQVLFRTSWVPIFLSATGDAELTTPEGAGVVITKGTQVVVQLHLLNAGKTPITTKYAASMHKSPLKSPEPIGVVAFGATKLSIPAKSITALSDTCTVPDDLEIFAAGPHMHYLGKALKFEAGPSDDKLNEIYRSENFDFNQQVIEERAYKLPRGWKARVTCEFDNPRDHEVTFGESSNDEMCFFVTFARRREGVTACSSGESKPAEPTNPLCGTAPENSLGVGRKCTKGGKECGSGLMCTLDQTAAPEGSPGFCFKLGCNATADCGGGDAVCCAPKEAGGLVKTCLPATCRPTDCAL